MFSFRQKSAGSSSSSNLLRRCCYWQRWYIILVTSSHLYHVCSVERFTNPAQDLLTLLLLSSRLNKSTYYYYIAFDRNKIYLLLLGSVNAKMVSVNNYLLNSITSELHWISCYVYEPLIQLAQDQYVNSAGGRGLCSTASLPLAGHKPIATVF